MGITGLIPFLKKKNPAIERGHLRDFKNKRVAIDAYCWLHRGVFCCAEDLFFGRKTTKYIDYCMKYINLLKHFKIMPVLVFDGKNMPMKIVDKSRHESRTDARNKANLLVASGQNQLARPYMSRAIDITHEMALALIKVARNVGVECIIAPYEADAQLAFLEINNYVDFVITEDSDLIVYGCRNIFFKLDDSGAGEVYTQTKLWSALQLTQPEKFEFRKFRHACILSGCDYVQNLPGIGLVKSWKFMCQIINSDIRKFLLKIPLKLNMPNLVVDDDYIENFVMADIAFSCQEVFDPKLKLRVPVNLPSVNEIRDEDYSEFIKKFLKESVDCYQLALGNIDMNNKVYDNYNPESKLGSIFCSHKKGKENESIKPNQSIISYKRVKPVDCHKNKVVIEENMEECLKPIEELVPTGKYFFKKKQPEPEVKPAEINHSISTISKFFRHKYVKEKGDVIRRPEPINVKDIENSGILKLDNEKIKVLLNNQTVAENDDSLMDSSFDEERTKTNLNAFKKTNTRQSIQIKPEPMSESSFTGEESSTRIKVSSTMIEESSTMIEESSTRIEESSNRIDESMEIDEVEENEIVEDDNKVSKNSEIIKVVDKNNVPVVKKERVQKPLIPERKKPTLNAIKKTITRRSKVKPNQATMLNFFKKV
ncbi:PREDICTED: exonuclease 1 [Nicrophorus vespilloides]|uniref:Exonuclease 1 n=1 Tax=Nicrophorus vespilloides TaxID=110193 RepID=A0ABM1N0A1_NICVS|nr:PREDICTED: exonuclease 1 [Nicrophorus vespilloides]